MMYIFPMLMSMRKKIGSTIYTTLFDIYMMPIIGPQHWHLVHMWIVCFRYISEVWIPSKCCHFNIELKQWEIPIEIELVSHTKIQWEWASYPSIKCHEIVWTCACMHWSIVPCTFLLKPFKFFKKSKRLIWLHHIVLVAYFSL